MFLPMLWCPTSTIFDTAKEFKQLGHDVSVFTGFPARTDLNDVSRFDRYEYKGINVHRFHHAYAPWENKQTLLN